MSVFVYVLVFINFFWLILMTLSIYKKNRLFQKIDLLPISNSSIKIKITRFNPFENVGGDQSFILTILDQSNSGALITSLHHRDLTRIYAKPIKEGEGDNITLSKEEKLAIVNTIKG